MATFSHQAWFTATVLRYSIIFPPLSYFPTTWLHRLGMDFVGSWLLTMVLYTLLAAWGMFVIRPHVDAFTPGGMDRSPLHISTHPNFLFDSVNAGDKPGSGCAGRFAFLLCSASLGWHFMANGGTS